MARMLSSLKCLRRSRCVVAYALLIVTPGVAWMRALTLTQLLEKLKGASANRCWARDRQLSGGER